jgi:transposase-like protein
MHNRAWKRFEKIRRELPTFKRSGTRVSPYRQTKACILIVTDFVERFSLRHAASQSATHGQRMSLSKRGGYVVHWYRNIFSHVPSAKVREIAAMLKAIHTSEGVAAAREKAVCPSDRKAARPAPELAASWWKRRSTGLRA